MISFGGVIIDVVLAVIVVLNCVGDDLRGRVTSWNHSSSPVDYDAAKVKTVGLVLANCTGFRVTLLVHCF